MSRWRLVLESLRHRRRAALGVTLGFALSAAVLVGALLVGDSVRGSLAQRARASIGRVAVALVGGERRVRTELADELQAGLADSVVAPLLQLDAVASADGGARRANDVVLHGVDARFFALAPGNAPAALPGAGEVLLNERLAQQLGVTSGAEVLLRVAAPSVLSRDMLLETADEASVGLRVTVVAVLDDDAFGRFSLAATPLPPFGAFVDLGWLQAELELGGRVNTLLLGARDEVDPGELAARANVALRERWQLADAELELIELEVQGAGALELRSPRVFLEAPVLEVASRFPTAVVGVLTYFVNALSAGDRSTPYSMVTALGGLGAEAIPPELRALVPDDLGRDSLVVNDWLARDLGVGAGDEVMLRYFVPGPDRTLAEEERAFRVRAVVPIEGIAADPEWMPEFPGISDSEHCRDWESGVPIDYDAVRDEDESYWDEHRGTPKAFLSLAAGQAMWSNPWGVATAVRFSGLERATLAASLRAGIDPAELGLFFADVRTPVLAGSASATDFGGLFLGLSFFLIAAALSLTALLFAFGVDQRAVEIGTLLATGFRPRDVRRLFLIEAALLAGVGTVIGALAGTGYTKLVLRGLATVWSGAVASSAIEYHARPATFAIGAGATVLAALGASWFALRRALRRSALELLSSRAGVASAGPRRVRAVLPLALLAGALALGVAGAGGSARTAAGTFFGAGALFLLAGIAAARAVIARAGAGGAVRSVARLGLANAARRPGRSLAVVGLFAAGTFLVLSIGVHRKHGAADALSRGAGTGGFALFGRSALPLYENPGEPAGREAFGLDEEELAGVSIVPLRVRAGDDASCLNLGQPQRPQLVGVDPRELAERGAFTFAATGADPGDESPWLLLEQALADGAVPAVADASSAKWTMKKALGEGFEYEDGQGRAFEVRLVALIEDSILQGNLVISAADFRARFPAESGTKLFLVDAPPARAEAVAATLSRALQDEGLELTPAARRLDEFNAVQNAYLDVFQVLGGLGLLLGSAGLGLVVLRNALERRSELALLRAVGWSRGALRRVLVAEHLLLFALGLSAGVLAALLAVLPAQAGASLASAAPLVAAIALNGALWVLVASALAARGELVAGLRSE